MQNWHSEIVSAACPLKRETNFFYKKMHNVSAHCLSGYSWELLSFLISLGYYSEDSTITQNLTEILKVCRKNSPQKELRDIHYSCDRYKIYARRLSVSSTGDFFNVVSVEAETTVGYCNAYSWKNIELPEKSNEALFKYSPMKTNKENVMKHLEFYTK